MLLNSLMYGISVGWLVGWLVIPAIPTIPTIPTIPFFNAKTKLVIIKFKMHLAISAINKQVSCQPTEEKEERLQQI